MIVQVEHEVKVIVTVDTEARSIVKVWQDEAVEPTGNYFDSDGEPIEFTDDAEVAAEVASESEWPAWERGY